MNPNNPLDQDEVVSNITAPVTGVYILNFNMVLFGGPSTGVIFSTSGGLNCPLILYDVAQGIYQCSGTCVITLAASTEVLFKISYVTGGGLQLSSGFSTLTRIG
jgi:hypothetical protein